MKTRIVVASVLAMIASLQAQTTVSTDPVGFVSKTIPANSDGTFAPSVQQPASFVGTIATINDPNNIKVSGSPGWTANSFVTSGTYYCLISSGAREGVFATITANGTDTLTLAYVVQDLGTVSGDKVVVGDVVKIIPYWTLGTLLPDATKTGGFAPDKTTVFLYSRSQAGTNKSASHFYTLYATYGWYDGGTPSDSQIIYPDESIVVRAPSGASVPITQTGSVLMNKYRTSLDNITPNVDQDIRLGVNVPVPVGLRSFMDAGLPADGDTVFIFNDAAVGQNKSATNFFTYYNTYGWYDGGTNVDAYQLQPGQGIVYRKLGSHTGSLVVTYKPGYQP